MAKAKKPKAVKKSPMDHAKKAKDVGKITEKDVKQELPKYKRIAEEYASDKKKIAYLLDDAIKKSRKHKGVLAKAWDDLTTMIRLVRAYFRGEYTSVPWETIVWAIAAIIYFVSPIDLIPDFIPVIGYVDDVIVIALVVASIRDELENFREWEKSGEI